MANELFLPPSTLEDIEATKSRCKALVTKRALMSAGVSMVPIPGLDFATDVGLLMRLLPEINRLFGLTPAQIERLNPRKQILVYRAMVTFGGALIGRLVTQSLVIQTLKSVGIRLTTKQATKYVPIAGQALSAALGFTAIRYVGLKHIEDCVRVLKGVINDEQQAAAGYPKAERVR
ncbi:MAG: hypothetical protein H0U63_04815 [Burkholderiales bacterium]|nr:hypothetical protein [Burkholderiales bacterium]